MSKYEKKYYNALLDGFRECGKDFEWPRLDELRLKCGVPRKRAEELVSQILESEKLEEAQCEAIKSDIIITPDNFIEKHTEKSSERANLISEYKKCQAAIKNLKNELESLRPPVKISNPGEIGWLSFLLFEGIGVICILWLEWYWVGGIIAGLATVYLFVKVTWRAIFQNYEDNYHLYVRDKFWLEREIVKKESYLHQLSNVISESLYSELNDGCSLPLSRDSLSNDIWEKLNDRIEDLFRLRCQCSQSSEADSRMADMMRYYDERLKIFYEFSIRGETSDAVYDIYKKQLKEAENKQQMYLLRRDVNEDTLMATKKYGFSDELKECKKELKMMNLTDLLKDYSSIKEIKTAGMLGITNMSSLSKKTDQLKGCYEMIESEYSRLQTLGDIVNNYLTEMRTIAYRNIYLGVELLNIIRDNAGGKKLSSQKDSIVTASTSKVSYLGVNAIKMDYVSNISDTVDGLAEIMFKKSNRKWVEENPKMALGVAALAVVGNLIDERLDTINNNLGLQKEYISGIDTMVDGFNSGKAQILRAVEVITALSKLNIAFLGIYAPLRDKVFVKGDMDFSKEDMQKLAKAIQEYKHSSDTSL